MLFEIKIFSINHEWYESPQSWGDLMEDSRELEKLFREWLVNNDLNCSWTLKTYRVGVE